MIKLLLVLLVAANPFILLFYSSSSDFDSALGFDNLEEWGSSLAFSLSSANPNFLPIRNWNIQEAEVDARAAVILSFNPLTETQFDFKPNEVLYQKNADLVLPIASITKLMTAIVILENMELNQVIIISEEALTPLGSRAKLQAGESLTVEKLLQALLIPSSNDAAYALARALEEKTGVGFADLMNQKAKNLGLENTRFVDSSGISSGNVSTAYDIARLVKYSFEYPIIWQIAKLPEINASSVGGKVHHHWINTDELLNKYPNIIGGKTGYTQEAQGCLMIVYQPNELSSNYLISVVLGAKKRFLETERLIRWSEEAYAW